MDLKKALRHALDDDELSCLVRSYDLIGDIAVTIVPPELDHREQLIGETILALNKRIRVVARRVGNYHGEYRTLPLSVIAGEDRLLTTHREFGVLLTVDLRHTYFSPRSGNERKRIADLIAGPEQILVMFSGIAPYPLMFAKHSPATAIIGIEKNRRAHDLALINRQRNKAVDAITLLHGDVRTVVPSLATTFDRIVMPLPGPAGEFVDLALSMLRSGGSLHLYDFKPRDRFADTTALLRTVADRCGRSVVAEKIVVCGHNSPTSYRICADAVIN